MSNPIIEMVQLEKLYNKGLPTEVRALQKVDLRIEKGEFIAIVGPSGSGKSTLMHLLGLLDTPTSGVLRIDGEDVASIPRSKSHLLRAKKIGFVFQGFNLLPILTAIENVAEAALYAGTPKQAAFAKAEKLLTTVGLHDKLNNFPSELSGGQQQRVAIARALINEPSLILADEPTGELDSKNANAIMDLLETISKTSHQTIIIVTHSEAVAARCNTVITLVDGAIESIHHTKNHS